MASKEEKRRLIEGYAASGMTRREYCAKHGMAVSTLDYWRLKRKPKLARVAIKGAIAPQEAGPGFARSKRRVFGLGLATKIYLALDAVDMRKGFEGLHGLVRDQLGQDPLSGHLFLFTNRTRTRLKRSEERRVGKEC